MIMKTVLLLGWRVLFFVSSHKEGEGEKTKAGLRPNVRGGKGGGRGEGEEGGGKGV